MTVRFSKEVSYSARGHATHRIEMWHDGLKRHRQIRGSEYEVVERKAQLQAEEWESRWKAIKAKEATQKHQANQKAFAKERTREARAALETLERTLEHTLSIDDAVDWEQLKDISPFPEPRPRKPIAPTYPKEPSPDEEAFQPDIGFLDRLISSRRQSKEVLATNLYHRAHAVWLQETSRLKELQDKALENHAAKDASWRERRTAFLEKQRECQTPRFTASANGARRVNPTQLKSIAISCYLDPCTLPGCRRSSKSVTSRRVRLSWSRIRSRRSKRYLDSGRSRTYKVVMSLPRKCSLTRS